MTVQEQRLQKEKVRVFELARELDLESKDLMVLCRQNGIELKNQLSTVGPELREQILELVKRGPSSSAAQAARTPAAPVLPTVINRKVQTLALVNPYDRPFEKVVTPRAVAALRDKPVVALNSADRVGALAPLDYGKATYVYAARVFDPKVKAQIDRAGDVLQDYRTLLRRSRTGARARWMTVSSFLSADTPCVGSRRRTCRTPGSAAS